MSKYDEIKQRVYQCNMDLPEHGVVIFTFGNASAIDRREGIIAIKPSGISYNELTPDLIVILDINGKIIEGSLKPSSDTNTHLELYKNFPKIGGVVHTHSTYATAWAQARKPIPIMGTTHADHLTEDIPVTRVISDNRIQCDYETQTGQQIITRFNNLSYEEIEMVLVACHGPFTWGKTAEKAVYNAVILEELAKMATLTLQVNPETPRLKQTLIEKHYYRKHGKNAYYGQETTN